MISTIQFTTIFIFYIIIKKKFNVISETNIYFEFLHNIDIFCV